MDFDFGHILRGLMANRSLTVDGLARAAGVAHSHVSQLLHGYPPRPTTIRRIAPALGMTPDDLLVIAGMSIEDVSARKRHPLHRELRFLEAAASRLSLEQVETLITHAHRLHKDNADTNRSDGIG